MSSGAFPLLLGAFLLLSGAPATLEAGNQLDCSSWQDCREQVEDALAAAAFERAHDLAWRAVQRGPKDDPGLMFLLSRTQCLSGRPHDALVMVRRLAQRGAGTEAATHPDLERTRALPGWGEVEALLSRVAAGEPASATPPGPAERARPTAPAEPLAPAGRPVPADAVPGPAAASEATATVSPRPSARIEKRGEFEETFRVSADRFVAAGLAYDAVSHRFVVGDQHGRKLRVVGERVDHAVDLVRAESAGFFAVRALEIDHPRGDLWVLSATEDGSAGALHRLQLVSGRPLRTVPFAADTLPVHPVDLGITPTGAVLMLDRRGRLFRVRPGAAVAELVMELSVEEATSVATNGTEHVVFVAHAAGVSRVDVSARTVSTVTAPAGVTLGGFERLRAHRTGLAGLQRDADGARWVVRLDLATNGRSVRSATVFDTMLEAGTGPVAFALSGDDVSLITGDTGSSRSPASSALGPPAELIVRRLRLR